MKTLFTKATDAKKTYILMQIHVPNMKKYC